MIPVLGHNIPKTQVHQAIKPDDVMAQARMQILRLQAEPEHHTVPKTPSMSAFSKLKNWVAHKFNHKG